MTNLQVASISSQLAAALVIEHHYLHRRPPISYAIGLWEGDEAVGVMTLGVPPSRHAQQSVCPSNPSLALELNRLWVADDQPGNTETWFLARALRLVPSRLVFSYADTTRGHTGYVYRAANFHYAGWTDMDRKTPRYDYIPISGNHTRDAFRTGVKERVRRVPKFKYWTATGNRAERRALVALCGWPSYDWKVVLPGPGDPELLVF